MQQRFRFRVRTLLWGLSAVAVALGALRWRYDAYASAERRERDVLASLDFATAEARWRPAATLWPRQFSQIEHLWLDNQTIDLARPMPRVGELRRLQSIQVLARQIAGHATRAAEGHADAVIAALRQHPSLRTIIVDASIRGAPLEYGAPLYTREDKALLEKLLPNVRVEWIEVN